MPTTDPLTPELEAMTKSVPGMDRRDLPQLGNDVGVAFETRPTEASRGQAAVQDEVAQSDLVRRDEAAGPAAISIANASEWPVPNA
jgi:hypothetical protein